MKRTIIVTFIAGLTGCQGSPSLTANKLSELSNEDLCRALGTYNNDGASVLKIYDELKKRPDKIDPERCYTLEKIKEEQDVEFKVNDASINTLYIDGININPSDSNNSYQSIDPQHYKIIHNPRKNNKINEKNEIDTDILEKINSFNITPTYKSEPYIKKEPNFRTRKIVIDKLDIKEEEMSTIMRECLKKHISKSQF